MNKLQQEAVKLRLNKMLNGSRSFSVCDLDSLARSMGVNAESHPDYKTLSNLHCVAYSEMSSELKAALPNMIMNCLSARFETDLMSKALAAVANGEIKDLPDIEDGPTLRLFNSK